MPGQLENVTLPKQTTSATVKWLSGETDQATESTATFKQAAGTPKIASAYTELSDKLLRQSNPAAEAVVTVGIAKDLAVGVDGATFAGSGGAGQPLGITSTLGIGAGSGGALAYAGLVQAQKDVADANGVVMGGSLGYVTTPTVAQTLKGRSRFSNTDSPLWKGAIHEGEIEGVRALSTKGMPANSMLYGDFSSVVLAEWGVLEVQVNPFADFKAGIVGVRALWAVDVIVLHPESFVLISSIS